MGAWSIACGVPSPPPDDVPTGRFTSAQPARTVISGFPFSCPSTGAVVPAETHVERGPLDRHQVFELIRDRLADILEIGPETISEGSSFTEDLDADSLALIELVEALEEEL